MSDPRCWQCDRRMPVKDVNIKLGSITVLCPRCKAPNVLPRPQAAMSR